MLATFGLVVVTVAAAYVLYVLLRAYREFRGVRVVVCPETKAHAAVQLSAGRAAVSRLLGEPELRLSDCSRWPERRNCGQECLTSIEAAPTDCLVRNMIRRCYQDKSCVLCGRNLSPMPWLERPALLSPEGRTFEWVQVPAEMLPQTLAAARPVCWNCHTEAVFRRLHPAAPSVRSSQDT